MSRLRNLVPRQLLHTRFRYAPLSVNTNSHGATSNPATSRFQWPKSTHQLQSWLLRLVCGALIAIAILSLILSRDVQKTRKEQEAEAAVRHPPQTKAFPWTYYERLNAYFNGIRTLGPPELHEAENRYNLSSPPDGLTEERIAALPRAPSLEPFLFDPYPDYKSSEYLKKHHEVQTCFLDNGETSEPPDVYAYPGLPLNFPDPFYGSYSELGLRNDICFDRFGRLGLYGFVHNESGYGTGPEQYVEHEGREKIFQETGFIDYRNINWGEAQRRCNRKNQNRFDGTQLEDKVRIPKQAYVLRVWIGYKWRLSQTLTIRAMITELSLKTGGEYDVHLLVHVRNNSLPVWADPDLYRQTLEDNVPQEFWNISTLWSEQQMRMYYPSPFGFNFGNMLEEYLHGVYRSPHFALQWFSQQHPEYDFIWNWEMDMRYTGHYYDFHTKVGVWAKKQPRKGLWERNSRFWFPRYHGDFATDFTTFVERETHELDILSNNAQRHGPIPVWGPLSDFAPLDMQASLIAPTSYEADNYTWGVGEEADLIVFNPIFDPSKTNWVLRTDVTGYPADKPIPPRRAAIITAARLSRRLLDTMHRETWANRHAMFTEMWPATVCLHHGLKAVYAPHPVYFNHDWELEKMVQLFNRPKAPHESPFGWGEHMMLGSTFYYKSVFSAKLWRRWLGLVEDGEGGKEAEEEGTGRMCLRPMLHHPVKHDDGLEEYASPPPLVIEGEEENEQAT